MPKEGTSQCKCNKREKANDDLMTDIVGIFNCKLNQEIYKIIGIKG